MITTVITKIGMAEGTRNKGSEILRAAASAQNKKTNQVLEFSSNLRSK